MIPKLNGAISLKPGEEKHERVWTKMPYANRTFEQQMRVYYYYKTPGGELFATIASSLTLARTQRDQWLLAKGEQWTSLPPNPAKTAATNTRPGSPS